MSDILDAQGNDDDPIRHPLEGLLDTSPVASTNSVPHLLSALDACLNPADKPCARRGFPCATHTEEICGRELFGGEKGVTICQLPPGHDSLHSSKAPMPAPVFAREPHPCDTCGAPWSHDSEVVNMTHLEARFRYWKCGRSTMVTVYDEQESISPTPRACDYIVQLRREIETDIAARMRSRAKFLDSVGNRSGGPQYARDELRRFAAELDEDSA